MSVDVVLRRPVGALLAELHSLLDELNAADIAGEVAASAPAGVTALAADIVRARHRIEAAEATVLARLADTGVPAAAGLTPAGWVRRATRLDHSPAAARLRLGEGLRSLPRFAAAFAAGQIGSAHVRVLARVCDGNEARRASLPDLEPILVEEAKALPPKEFARVVARWVHTVDAAGMVADELRVRERAYLHVSATYGGMVAVDGMLDPESGAVLLAALAAARERLYADSDGSKRAEWIREPLSRRNVAAVRLLADSAVATMGTDRLGLVDGLRPTVFVTMDVETLMRQSRNVAGLPEAGGLRGVPGQHEPPDPATATACPRRGQTDAHARAIWDQPVHEDKQDREQQPGRAQGQGQEPEPAQGQRHVMLSEQGQGPEPEPAQGQGQKSEPEPAQGQGQGQGPELVRVHEPGPEPGRWRETTAREFRQVVGGPAGGRVGRRALVIRSGAPPGERPAVLHLVAPGSDSGPAPQTTLITAAMARRLACDAGIVPVVLGSAGVPLDLGRATRTVSGGQRKAVWLRDQHCRFPGCDRGIAEVHHIVEWSRGGKTDLANLLGLCLRHHHAVHEGGWRLSGSAAAPYFRRPGEPG
ncbi:MAG: DUF222 domain-containing protein [Actinomycetota bacterium]|nr:MAG: DUF222 domain-containing protein [Actinomycetota bacterium]